MYSIYLINHVQTLTLDINTPAHVDHLDGSLLALVIHAVIHMIRQVHLRVFD